MSSNARLRRWLPVAAAGAICLASATAGAVGGPSPGAVSAQTVKLPAGPGSVRGLAENATVSGFTGQVQYAVPIELPEGPGDLAPALSLGYDGSLGNGPLGVGWTLSQAGIRRSLRLGVPSYGAADELELVGLAGGVQLVPLAGGQYRAEGMGNAFSGRAVDGGFELVDPAGRVYRFGTTAAGRKASGAQVAFWYLEEVRDVAGQTIAYQYHQDRGEVYLDAIAWGPAVGGAPAFRAELIYETRGDAVVSYRTGFRVEAAQRLAQIRVRSFGAVQRLVNLGYDGAFALSRLGGVEVTSADGSDALPALAFSYAAPQAGALAQIPGLDGWALNLQGTSLFDVDGDGAMDLLRLTASGHSYRRNLGGQFEAPRTVAGAAGASLEQVRLLDLTGDSGAELVWQQGSQWSVFQLTGPDAANRSWTALGGWGGVQNVSLGAVAVADLNGDYRMDVISASGSSIQVRLGGETGLAAPFGRPAIDPARPTIAPGNAATSFPDINGDGLADAVFLGATSMSLYLGNGDGRFERYRDLPYPWAGTIAISQIRLGDLNRDGLVDVAVVRAGDVAWYRGLANGTVDAAPVLLTRPAGTDASVVVAIADANGNGSEDLVWSSPAGMWILDFAGPTSAGMLTAIANGMGQSQEFRYTASTQLAQAAAAAGAPWTAVMPISIPVSVGMRLVLASGEPTRSSRLDVRDGIYDRGERRFLGFGETTVTRPDPADGAAPDQTVRRIQRFAAGLGAERPLRGHVLHERLEDGTGRVFRDTTNELATLAVAGLPADPRLLRAIVRSTQVAHLEGQADPIATRIEYAYDDEGRAIEERKLGRLDLAGDESIVRRRYTDGRSPAGVRDKVCELSLVGIAPDGSELAVSRSQVLYGDAQHTAALCDASNGWETTTRSYLTAEARWIDTKVVAFDAVGNPVEIRDNGVTRRLAYDGHALHPIAESTAPSATRTLRWEATWDDVEGVPTAVRDAGDVTTTASYDGLGRLREAAVLGAPAHEVHRYHVAGPRPSVETFQFDGDPAAATTLPETWTPTSRWRHAIAVFDSAGEPVFTATRLTADRWLVAGYRRRDAHGRTIAIADAFEWQGSAAGVVGVQLPPETPVRTTAYDALDRVVARTLPTGAADRYSYRAFEATTATDGLAPVTTRLDGEGRVIRTARTLGGQAERVDARYDAAGHIVGLHIEGATPASAADHSFAYDSLGRMVFATDPDIGERRLTYDDGGRVVSYANGAGQVLSYAYDGAGRLTSAAASDGAQLVYHYDDPLDAAFTNTAGRLAWVEEATGRAELGYDAFGRTDRVRRRVHGEVAEEHMVYAPSGLMLRSEHSDGLVIAYQHDAAGRTTAVGDLWQIVAQDPSGRTLSERYGNGVVETFDRNPLGQPTHMRILPPTGAAIYDVGIAYNAFGAIASVTDGDATGLDHTAAFSYDGGGRLLEALIGRGAAQYQFRYQYDGLQNMIRREAHGPSQLGILTGTYQYAGTGPRRLTAVAPDPAAGSPAGAATTTFEYDGAGRVTREGAMALSYNGFDQLIRVTGVAGGAVDHAYGYDGLRVYTRSPTGEGQIWFSPATSQSADGARNHFVRIGDRLIARVTTRPAAAARAADARTGAQIGAAISLGLGGACAVLLAIALCMPRRRRRAVVAAFALSAVVMTSCSPGLSNTASAVSVSQILYYHQTVAAGPTLSTREDGTIFDERRFEPFGAPIGPVDYARDGVNALNKQSDPATGWSDHGARWMAPETARWLTPDPPVKAPDPGFMNEPWSLHPYQYVSQNPVLYWDPDGKGWRDWVAGVCGAVVGALDAVTFDHYSKWAFTEDQMTEWRDMGHFAVGYTGGKAAATTAMLASGVGSINAGLQGARVLVTANTGMRVLAGVNGARVTVGAGLVMMGAGNIAMSAVKDGGGGGGGSSGGSGGGGKRGPGVSNPEIAKLRTPARPPGVTQSQFGKEVVRWGTGPGEAQLRAATITAEDVATMQSQGLTREMAVEWREFYTNEFARNANNLTARNRMGLLDKILKMMD